MDTIETTSPRTASHAIAERRRCQRCHAFLARDNHSDRCSPCWQAELVAQAAPLLARCTDEARLREAFAAGGVRAVARALDRSDREALELVLAHGLIPARMRARADSLRALLELDHLSHIAAAHELGLSRWTVATYRGLLGVTSPG